VSLRLEREALIFLREEVLFWFVVRREGRFFASLPRWWCLLAFKGYGVFCSSMMCIIGGSFLPAIRAVELCFSEPLLDFGVLCWFCWFFFFFFPFL